MLAAGWDDGFDNAGQSCQLQLPLVTRKVWGKRPYLRALLVSFAGISTTKARTGGVSQQRGHRSPRQQLTELLVRPSLVQSLQRLKEGDWDWFRHGLGVWLGVSAWSAGEERMQSVVQNARG